MAYVHTFRLGAYTQLNRPKEAMTAADQAIDSTVKLGEKLIAKADADAKLSDRDKENMRKKDKNITFLDKNSPEFRAFMDQSELRILALYQTVIQVAQQVNDAAKMMEYGEKALGFRPDDLNTLMILSNVMAERPPATDAEKTKHMQRAEELANLALQQFPKFTASPEAARLTPEQKNELNGQLHYTLGLIFLHQKRYGPSQTEFLTAIKSNSKDPVVYYRLGIAYVQDTKVDQAIDALAKSVFLKGVSEASARDVLKQLYVQKNKSENGLEDYIKAAGAKIGQ
jgi:tetratricopeptide (TPR) repeat protein